MKLIDVKIGQEYLAKVSGKLCIVRITGMHVSLGRKRFDAVNTNSGRKIIIKSAAKLRCVADVHIKTIYGKEK